MTDAPNTSIVSTEANSLLASILNEAAETKPDFGREREFVVNDTIEIVQSKGNRHDVSNIMKLYAGPRDVVDGTYSKYFDFILVDVLYDTIPDGKYMKNRGGRQMWGYINNSGKWERDLEAGGPACSSQNGIAPRPEFLGKEIVDIRNGNVHKIGFQMTDDGGTGGEWIPVTEEVMGPDMKMHVNVCKTCPLGQWRTDPITDKRQPPPCADAWGYVVFVLPHNDDNIAPENRISEGFLAVIRGQNSGVQLALPGARAGTPAARQDGTAFMGIVAPFRPNPESRNAVVVRRVGEVNTSQYDRVLGFCTGENKEGFVAAKLRGSDGRTNDVFTRLRNKTDEFPFMVLSVPTYPFAPNGLPEDAGGSVPLVRVEMHVAKNGYKLGSAPNPTLVPEIVVSGRELNIQDYAAYLEARKRYRQDDGRGQLMRFDLLPIVDEALRTGILPETSIENSPPETDELPF